MREKKTTKKTDNKLQNTDSRSTLFYFALLILCTVSHLLKTTIKREEAKATGMAAVSAEREQITSGLQKKSGNVTDDCGLPGFLPQIMVNIEFNFM